MEENREPHPNQINGLCKLIHQNNKEKGFWDNERNFGELLMLITSELGECIEAHRKGKSSDISTFNKDYSRPDFIEDFKSNIKDTYQDELADAVIRIFDMAGGLGIDLESHIYAKLNYNMSRPKLHGKIY